MKKKSPPSEGDKATLERVCQDGVWCLLVCEGDGTARAFLDHCSHKDIPLGPKARLKRGAVRCPYHDVCFDRRTGAVINDNGKKVPDGLIPVPVTTTGTGETPQVSITDEHRAYLASRGKRGRKKKA